MKSIRIPAMAGRKNGGAPSRVGARPHFPHGHRPAVLYDATPEEERYLAAELLTPAVYGTPRLIRIEGALDRARFATALAAVIARHPGLRCGFLNGKDGIFRKYIVDDAPAALQFVELPGADVEAINAFLRPIVLRKPDFTPASLSHYHLIRAAPELHYFSYANHHSISDGQTARIILEELFALYLGEELPAPGPAPHEVIPADWRQSELYRDALSWWEEKLRDTGEIFGLPADIDDPAAPEMLALDQPLGAATAEALAKGRAFGVSEFAVAYAVLLVLLARLSGKESVCSTFQSNGRRPFPAAARSVGTYSNAVVLKAKVDPAQSFRAFVGEVAAGIRDGAAHEFVPYHHVIEKTGVHPRFGMNWYPNPTPFHVPGLKIEDASHSLRESDYQLNFRFLRAGEQRRLVLFYRARELTRERVELLIRQYELLAQALAAAPDAPLAATRLADLVPMPRDPAPVPPAAEAEPITADFLAAAARFPERIACQSDGETLSYAALLRRAGGAAAALDAAGVPPGAAVAILGARNAAFVQNLLGVSIRGGAFVALDSAYPDRRLLQMIADVGPRALLFSGGDDLGERALALAQAAGAATGAEIPAIAVDPAAEAEAPATPDHIEPGAPAYVLFTSGTTGEPKGIVHGHRPLLHFTRWQRAQFAIGPDDRVTMFSGLGHDPLMRDIFTCLGAGATLVIPTQEEMLQPGGLPRFIARTRPTVAHMTPPLGELMLAGAAEGALSSLRLLFWGGDLLPPALAGRVRGVVPGARQVNFYGSTETPQAAAFFEIPAKSAWWRSVPVGRGTSDHVVHAVDRSGAALGPFEPGEVEVVSPYLSLGRIRGGVLAAPATPGRYRTGDLGFHRADGVVSLVGRIDDQVKIRGFRIEPADIAHALERHPDVERAVVLVEGEGSRKRLVAFTIDRLEDARRRAILIPFLLDLLPPYMVPEAFFGLAALPLLPNGKLDRPALLRQAGEESRNRVRSAARNEHERQLIEHWGKVLGRDDIAPEDSLLSLGGDSLNFVNLYLATENALGATPDGWQGMTIRELAAAESRPDRFWRPVDSAVLTRAIAIFIVVAEHLRFIPYLDGATTALFMVTGYFFGGLQLSTAFHKKSVAPLLRMMVNLLIPVLGFSLLLYVYKTLDGRQPSTTLLTLTGDFFDYRNRDRGGREFYLWYLHAMIHILLMILVLVWAANRLSKTEPDPWRFCAILFGAGVVARFVPPAIFFPGFLEGKLPLLSFWSYLPTTHFPSVLLGCLLVLADSHVRRLLLVPVVLLYASAQLWFFPGHGGIYVLLFGLLLLFQRRVPLPRLLSRLVLPLSGASLYLYLTHFQFAALLQKFGIMAPALHVLAAILGGILLWRGYSWLSAIVTRWLRQREGIAEENIAEPVL